MTNYVPEKLNQHHHVGLRVWLSRLETPAEAT